MMVHQTSTHSWQVGRKPYAYAYTTHNISSPNSYTGILEHVLMQIYNLFIASRCTHNFMLHIQWLCMCTTQHNCMTHEYIVSYQAQQQSLQIQNNTNPPMFCFNIKTIPSTLKRILQTTSVQSIIVPLQCSQTGLCLCYNGFSLLLCIC